MKESASGQTFRLDECLSRNDLFAAFSELKVLGDEWGADHNFWRYLGDAAHDLGLSDDEERCRIKSDQDYSAKAIQMPDTCKGLPIIELYSIDQACLILLAKSGFVYWNQTAGVACGQRGEEGVLVPLLDRVQDESGSLVECPLHLALADLAWGPVLGIVDDKRADEIDALFRRFYFTECLSVDRSRLLESEEAWVYVRINPFKFRLGVNVATEAGVLVWPNSD